MHKEIPPFSSYQATAALESSVATRFTTLCIEAGNGSVVVAPHSSGTSGVEIDPRNSRSVSSRRLRMGSISARVITTGGSTRTTRELLRVPEMSVPRGDVFQLRDEVFTLFSSLPWNALLECDVDSGDGGGAGQWISTRRRGVDKRVAVHDAPDFW